MVLSRLRVLSRGLIGMETVWGWHASGIGGWKHEPRWIWNRRNEENHRDCFDVHSVNSFLKANNVRSSCFTEKQGFLGAKTTTSKPSPHRVLSENPRRHIHVHWFPYVQCYCLRLPSIGTLNLLTRHETKSTARHSITYT